MSSSVFSFFHKLLYHNVLNDPDSEKSSETDGTVSLTEQTTPGDQLRLFLDEMVTIGGAGTWPPQAAHGDAWPSPLRPYHHIFKDLSPTLCTEESSTDDEVNSKRIIDFRSRMSDALAEIDLNAVVAVLESAEKSGNSAITAECYNGFFACMVYLRHAYRYVSR